MAKIYLVNFFATSHRWILSHFFKDDINDIYGIYPENDDIVMEVVDRNDEYEQAAASEETNREQNHENREYEYDSMYDSMNEQPYRENTYDRMYD